jgi:hypothetical protein
MQPELACSLIRACSVIQVRPVRGSAAQAVRLPLAKMEIAAVMLNNEDRLRARRSCDVHFEFPTQWSNIFWSKFRSCKFSVVRDFVLCGVVTAQNSALSSFDVVNPK